jgi:hypothetical protein
MVPLSFRPPGVASLALKNAGDDASKPGRRIPSTAEGSCGTRRASDLEAGTDWPDSASGLLRRGVLWPEQQQREHERASAIAKRWKARAELGLMVPTRKVSGL